MTRSAFFLSDGRLSLARNRTFGVVSSPALLLALIIAAMAIRPAVAHCLGMTN